MSCNEWERGIFNLSSTEFSKFKKELLERINENRLHSYQVSLEIHKSLKSIGKGKRNFDFGKELRLLEESGNKNLDWDLISDAIIDKETRKLKLPKKKDFAPLKRNQDLFEGPEFYIRFSPKEHKIVWNVQENNHACDDARDSFLGKEFFHLLSRVIWTTRTGGTIVGNNEYRSESCDEGGGANFVKDRYGCENKRT